LSCGSEIKLESFGRILLDSQTVLEKRTEIVLGGSVTMEGGSLIVAGSCGVILGNTTALLVEVAEYKFVVRVVLGDDGGTEPSEGQLEAGGGGILREKKLRKLESGGGIAGFCASFEFGDGNGDGGLLRAGRGETGRWVHESDQKKRKDWEKRTRTTKWNEHCDPSEAG
jgi:hypothetical protein